MHSLCLSSPRSAGSSHDQQFYVPSIVPAVLPQVADEWIDTLFPTQKHTQLQRIADWKDGRKAIAVCHNWFDCWRKPGELPSNSPGCPCPLGLGKVSLRVCLGLLGLTRV
jgi:hypothetical protein